MDNVSAYLQIMTCQVLRGNDPLPEPTGTQSTDTCMRHSAFMFYFNCCSVQNRLTTSDTWRISKTWLLLFKSSKSTIFFKERPRKHIVWYLHTKDILAYIAKFCTRTTLISILQNNRPVSWIFTKDIIQINMALADIFSRPQWLSSWHFNYVHYGNHFGTNINNWFGVDSLT